MTEEEMKKEFEALKKQLSKQSQELEKYKKDLDDKVKTVEAVQAEKIALEKAKAEEAEKLKSIQEQLVKTAQEKEEKELTVKEYKKKERLQPIQKWFETQPEETKNVILDSIVNYDEQQYKLFIDGKTQEPSKGGETEKPKVEQPKSAPLLSVTATATPVIENDESKQDLNMFKEHSRFKEYFKENK